MSGLRSQRALALSLVLAPLLGGCVAVPVAQIAAQALLQPSRPAPATQATSVAPDNGPLTQLQDGMAQASHKLSGMLHQVVGNMP